MEEVAEYGLTAMQQGMLFNSLYADQKFVDIEQVTCRLAEAVDVPRLEAAWSQMVVRHEALRTSFAWERRDEPVQRVHAPAPVSIERRRLPEVAGGDEEARIRTFLEADRSRGLALAEAPMFRLALFTMGPDDYLLVWTFHHALLDGRSFTIVLEEAFDLYDALGEGQTLELPPVRPYRDHVEHLAGADLGAAKAYWQEHLRGFSEPNVVPVAGLMSSPAESTKLHGERELRVSWEVTDALIAHAAREGVTLNTFVQGAWAILLSRYGRSEDVVFGATRAARHSSVEGAQDMVGCFINTVPVRARATADAPLLEMLRAIRESQVDVRAYEQTPLGELQTWTEVPKGRRLFESIIVFERYLMGAHLAGRGGAWSRRAFAVHEQGSFPLTLAVYQDGGLLVRVEYDQDLYDRSSVDRMLGHVATLLTAMADDPSMNVGDLPLATPSEIEALLNDFNPEVVEPASEVPFHRLFEATALERGDAIAVQDGPSGPTLSYAELDRRANRLARYLRGKGVVAESVVGLCVPRSLEMAVGLLGILKAGGAYLPMDPKYPAAALAFMMTDAEVDVVLTLDALREVVPEGDAELFCLDTDFASLGGDDEGPLDADVSADDIAYVIYTSGTTGKAKGVLIPHSAMVAHSRAIVGEYELTAADRALQIASISFDIAVEEIFPTWLVGATLVLRTDEMTSSVGRFLAGVRESKVSVLNIPTAFWHEVVHGLEQAGGLPPEVRLVLVGGEKASVKAYARWTEVLDRPVRWLNCYGPTEATVTCSSYDAIAAGYDVASGRELPIGRPTANARLYVLDGQQRPLPIGVPGQLFVGGQSIARGYLRRDELTAKAFTSDPFMGEGSRMYATGDLARFLPSGDIEFLGRIDHQVKIRGFRIELGDIESNLEAHAAVQRAVVLARQDSPGEKRLVAYVVSEVDQGTERGALRDHLAGRLPPHMLPSAYVFLEELPETPGGKVDTKSLRAPGESDEDVRDDIVLPRNETEQKLADLFGDILGAEGFGVHESFFDLGGHSLLAVRLIGQIERYFDKSLELAMLFQTPTVADLADFVMGHTQVQAWRFLQPIQPKGDRPALFGVHVLGFAHSYYKPLARYLGDDQPVYGLTAPIDDDMPTDVESLAEFYLEELRAFQPKGPYFLAAVSLGGTVALEMAQRLLRDGEEVGLLGMLDALGPGDLERVRVSNRVRMHLAKLRTEGPRYITDKLTGRVDTVVSKVRWYYTKALTAMGRPMPEELRIFAFQHENYDSTRAYEMAPYPGRITVYRATDEIYYSDEYLTSGLGWGHVAHGGVEVHDVPGEHLGILEEPGVQVLARAMRADMDRQLEE